MNEFKLTRLLINSGCSHGMELYNTPDGMCKDCASNHNVLTVDEVREYIDDEVDKLDTVLSHFDVQRIYWRLNQSCHGPSKDPKNKGRLCITATLSVNIITSHSPPRISPEFETELNNLYSDEEIKICSNSSIDSVQSISTKT